LSGALRVRRIWVPVLLVAVAAALWCAAALLAARTVESGAPVGTRDEDRIQGALGRR
jgi:hypothetical protein